MVDGLKRLIEQENKKMVETENWYELKFGYLGYTAMITRYEEYGHLCGYVKKDFEMTDEIYDALNDNSHGGITYDKDNWIGFDCAHLYDFDLRRYLRCVELEIAADIETHMQDETYRTLDYVFKTLQHMISQMVVERIKQENSVEDWN